MATKPQPITNPEPTVDAQQDVPRNPDGTIDSGQRFLDMIRDHIAMGTATEADYEEWKRRLGK